MAGEVTICNRALTLIGAETIRSLNEENKRARACKEGYPLAVDTLLGSTFWTFARALPKKLAPDPKQSHPWYEFVYQLPSDCYTPYYIDRERINKNWEVYGKFLATDVEEVYLQYTRYIKNTGDFSIQFGAALVHAVAGNICFSLVESTTTRREIRDTAEVHINRAIATDARIGHVYKQPQQDFWYDTFNMPDRFSKGDYPWLNTP